MTVSTPAPLHHAILDSRLGPLRLVASVVGVRAVLWPEEAPGRVRLPRSVPCEDDPTLAVARRELSEYLEGTRVEFSVPLDPVGTDFQLAVWEELRGVGHGDTTTYGAIAAGIGRPGAARAVGAAIGRNPLSIVVPCHRVVGADGSLTGFAGGSTAKQWLLDHEAAFDR